MKTIIFENVDNFHVCLWPSGQSVARFTWQYDDSVEYYEQQREMAKECAALLWIGVNREEKPCNI